MSEQPPANEQFERALALHRAGRLEEAGRIYEAVVKRLPAFARGHMMKGVLALQRGQPGQALAELEHARSLDDAHPGIHLNLGNALRALRRWDEAAASYRRALALDPRMVFAHNNLGNVMRDQGAFAEALACYERALAFDEHSFPAAANRAFALGALDRPRGERVAACEAALAIAHSQGLRDASVADVHNTLANLHAADGRLADALTHYDQAVALDPGFAEAHVNRASTLARLDRHEEARVGYQRALALAPENRHALKALALIWRRLGRDDEAAQVYLTWSRIDPDDPVPAHMHQALSGGAPPERASAAYVEREFDTFAATFDRVLAGLGYQAPRLVERAVSRHRAGAAPGQVLDAGCGTGLCAPFLRPLAARLVGVDLSGAMLAQARDRRLYDELVQSELCSYAATQPGRFDLVVSADVLMYFGRLDAVAAAFACALAPGGVLVFTVEAGHDAERGYTLDVTGRYTHHRAYVERALTDQGLHVDEVTAATLRHERATAVAGWVVVARRPQ